MRVLFFIIPLLLVGCQGAKEKVSNLKEHAGHALQDRIDEGKKAASKVVDEKVGEAKEAATKAVNDKVAQAFAEAGNAAQKAQADIMKGLNPGAGYEAEKGHAEFMAEHVHKAKEVDAHTKEWIEKTLGSTNSAIQALAIPTMQVVYEKFPEHRAWLEGQVKVVIKSSEGGIKSAWEDILTNWQRMKAIAESQR